jgi:hypothetical protein
MKKALLSLTLLSPFTFGLALESDDARDMYQLLEKAGLETQSRSLLRAEDIVCLFGFNIEEQSWTNACVMKDGITHKSVPGVSRADAQEMSALLVQGGTKAQHQRGYFSTRAAFVECERHEEAAEATYSCEVSQLGE